MTSPKVEWRRTLLAERAAIPIRLRAMHAEAIAERVCRLECLRDAGSVLGYVAIGAEVDLAACLVAIASRGVRILTPASGESGGFWMPWQGEGGGPPERSPAVASASLASPVVAIVPGVGFDTHGVRLGRGQGFYDRVLTELRRYPPIQVIGVAFERQVVADLPVDPWDVRMDLIVTERRIIDTAATGERRKEASAT